MKFILCQVSTVYYFAMDCFDDKNLKYILKTSFGFSDFRSGQAEIITYIRQGRHVLAVMPTGAGKSLCYQLPAIASSRQKLKMRQILQNGLLPPLSKQGNILALYIL